MFERLKLRGKETPLDTRPKYNDAANWYIEKFFILSNSRQIGMQPNPIQVSEMIILAQTFGTIGSLEEFIYIIQELDYIYLQTMSNKNE